MVRVFSSPREDCLRTKGSCGGGSGGGGGMEQRDWDLKGVEGEMGGEREQGDEFCGGG